MSQTPAPGEDPLAAQFENMVEAFFETGLGDAEAAQANDAQGDGPGVILGAEAAAELRRTFGGIAAQHLLPVRQLHRRLAEGPVSLDWVGLCRPAVATVGRTAVEMDLVDLVRPLDQLAAVLSSAERHGGQVIDGESRDALLQACDELVALFPEAFEGEDDPDAREGMIVHSSLRQVPQIGTVSLDKIFAAGLTTMGMLNQASSKDLTLTTGISSSLAQQVRSAVDRYREQTAELQAGGTPERVLAALRVAAADLKRHQTAFRAAPQTEEGARERKAHRQCSRLAYLRAETWLATLGEVQLVEELRRLPRDRVLERLSAYLSSFACPDEEPVSGSMDPVLPQE